MRDVLKQTWKRLFFAGLMVATVMASTADWPRH